MDFHALTFARSRAKAQGTGFQQPQIDLANVNAKKDHVWLLLLYKFNYNATKITKMFGHYFSASVP